MSDSKIQVPPDSTGKNIDTEQLTVSSVVVQRQRVQVAGASASDIVKTATASPGGSDVGLVVRIAGTPATAALTDTQLRATAVPVSGPITDTQLRANNVKVELYDPDFLDFARCSDGAPPGGTVGLVIHIAPDDSWQQMIDLLQNISDKLDAVYVASSPVAAVPAIRNLPTT